jgi:hypothetical protein
VPVGSIGWLGEGSGEPIRCRTGATPTSENSVQAKFVEFVFHALGRPAVGMGLVMCATMQTGRCTSSRR